MKCLDCRQPITQAAARKATTVWDDGKLVGMVHRKCSHVKAKREFEAKRTGKTQRDIYAEEAAARRSLEERRAKKQEVSAPEDSVETFRDWREPDTFDA